MPSTKQQNRKYYKKNAEKINAKKRQKWILNLEHLELGRRVKFEGRVYKIVEIKHLKGNDEIKIRGVKDNLDEITVRV